jgi:hypothetical protein
VRSRSAVRAGRRAWRCVGLRGSAGCQYFESVFFGGQCVGQRQECGGGHLFRGWVGWEALERGQLIEGLGGWRHREGRGLGLWVLAAAEVGEVAVAKIVVVVGIVEVVEEDSWVVDGGVVSEMSHNVWYVGRVLGEGQKVDSGSSVPSGAEAVEAAEEQIRNGDYFGVEVHWRCMNHGEG